MKYTLLTLLFITMISLTASAKKQNLNFKKLTWSEACKMAEKQNKIVFVDVMRPLPDKSKNQEWKNEQEKHFSSPEVSDFFEKNVIMIQMDMSKDAGKDFAPLLQMNMYPTYGFFMPNGDLLKVLSPYRLAQNPEALINTAKDALEMANMKRKNTRSIVFENCEFEEALKKAKKKNKIIFVDAYTDPCQPCIMMEKNVFTLDKVADFYNSNFINLKINLGQVRKDLAQTYGTSAYPAYLFINPNGELIYKAGGYTESDKFIQYGKDALSGIRYIDIKGKVQFPDNRNNMEIVKRQGFDKIILDSCKVNEDGTYHFRMKIEEPGVYTLECQKWQSVPFWAEDEDLEINFRGRDTARIIIKNPPYVHINGGKNNEVMNLRNYDNYRNYQLMIAISQKTYRIPGLNDETKSEVSTDFYSILGEESKARAKYLVENYGDRNSILSVLSSLKGEEYYELVEKTLANLEAKNPNYKPLLKYKTDLAEAKAQQERLAAGQPAPEFSYPTPDGKKNLGPQDFKGKILVLDFWASWCGPCRAEIPHLKEAYEEFKDKNVEFFSVSIDKDDMAWRKAMNEENMPWPQAHASNSGKDVMKQYQFSGIPYILVIDSEGNIVAKNLRGKALNKKLEELVTGKKKQSIAMPAMGM